LPDRTLAQQLSGAFVLFGTLVGAAFFVTALAYGVSWAWLRPELVRSQLAVSAESASHVAMLEQANGLRGYLLTHDNRFLDAYNRGEGDLARANEALTAYIGSVPELATAIVGTRLAEERWRERSGDAATGTRPEALVASMAEGAALFDAYRSEEALLAASLTQRNQILSRRDTQMVASRVALELTVFIAVLFLAVRQHGH
jgi:CHASE3 domain sensor protein